MQVSTATTDFSQVLAQIEAKLGICPGCHTRQILCEVLIQKKHLSGKYEDKNLTRLCMPCDEEWRKFYEDSSLTKLSLHDNFKKTFLLFLDAPKPEISGKEKAHKFLNPAHIMSRVYRDVGRKFLTDFYHAWLFLEGENPDITKNPRIMHFLKSEEE
jgi:hypothetical protein